MIEIIVLVLFSAVIGIGFICFIGTMIGLQVIVRASAVMRLFCISIALLILVVLLLVIGHIIYFLRSDYFISLLTKCRKEEEF